MKTNNLNNLILLAFVVRSIIAITLFFILSIVDDNYRNSRSTPGPEPTWMLPGEVGVFRITDDVYGNVCYIVEGPLTISCVPASGVTP